MKENVNANVVCVNEVANSVCANVPETPAVPENVRKTAEEQGVSYASMSKAFRLVLTETRSINQCVKLFTGIMKTPITAGKETHTISVWLQMAGVQLSKGKLTAKAVLDAWPYKSADGKMQFMYKNVVGQWLDTTGETPVGKPTYHFDGTAWKTCAKMQLVHVTEWSADVMLRGLLQGAFPEKTAKKVADSEAAWNEIKEVFRFEKRNDKGGINNTAIAVKKEEVIF